MKIRPEIVANWHPCGLGGRKALSAWQLRAAMKVATGGDKSLRGRGGPGRDAERLDGRSHAERGNEGWWAVPSMPARCGKKDRDG